MASWNVKGTTGDKVMTNSEGVIPLTFVLFSQFVIGDIMQLLLFKVGGWSSEQLAFQQLQVPIAIATQGIFLTKSENSVVPWNVHGT